MLTKRKIQRAAQAFSRAWRDNRDNRYVVEVTRLTSPPKRAMATADADVAVASLTLVGIGAIKASFSIAVSTWACLACDRGWGFSRNLDVRWALWSCNIALEFRGSDEPNIKRTGGV